MVRHSDEEIIRIASREIIAMRMLASFALFSSCAAFYAICKIGIWWVYALMSMTPAFALSWFILYDHGTNMQTRNYFLMVMKGKLWVLYRVIFVVVGEVPEDELLDEILDTMPTRSCDYVGDRVFMTRSKRVATLLKLSA